MNETVNDKNNASSENIKVFVRVKGPSNDVDSCLKINGNTITAGDSQFLFDYIGDGNTTQDMVFQIVGIPIATSVLKGYNGTIFAYGQTGTGKTYTMQGPFYSHEDPNFDNGDVYSEKQYLGLIPRIISYIFAQLSREAERNTKDDKKSSPVKYLCQASYYEIYNEQIFDLLTEGSDEPLNIHEDIKRGVFIDRLTTRSISTAEEAYKILEIGAWKRSTASTRMNTQSSRSHSVFTLTLQSKIEKDGITQIQESKLNLVDLAGSERQKLTGTTGQRLLEARNINKSLSALGQVIQSLVDMNNNKKKVHVGYRNSKLTFLLKDSLGGNSKTFLIANISPSTFSLAETLSTLRFAQCTKQVTNKAVVNQNIEENICNLKDQIFKLQQEINKFKEKETKNMNFQKSSEEINIYDFFEEWTKIHSDMERNQKEVVKKLETLEEIKQNQDKMIKSYTMIIKIRDSMIEQLRKKVESGKSLLIEKKLNKDESMDLPEYLFQWDNENKLLLDEIQELKFLHNQDPERKKLEKENFILQNQIDQLKKCKLEYENYLQLKTYYQRYIGLLTNQWFDSQKENQYLKQQLQQLSYTPNNTLKSMKPPLYPIDKENNYPFQHSNQQHTFKSLSLSSSKTSYTNEININHNTNFLININPTFNTQEQNIKNFEEKLLESEQFVKEFNQNLKSKAINYLSNSATLIKNNKKIEKDNNDKISLTNSPFSINQKQRRETLAINDLFSENENVEDLINMDDIYGIKEGSLSQKHDLDFDSFDGISFKKQRFSIETELSDSISPPNNTSLLVKHSSILHPSSTNNMNLDNTQETKLNSFLDQNEKVISLIEEEQKKILNSDIDNLHNDDINNGNLIKNENRVEKEVLSDNDNKTKNKIKQEEMNIKNDVIIYTEPLNDNSVVDKEEIEKVLTEQFVKIEEELKRKNSTLQSKVEQLENDLSKVNEKHKAILKEKELESLKLLDQYDNKSKELLSIIEENKTLKQDLQFAEDNKKQVEEQQLIISNLNSKILILEKAYEIEKSEKKGLSDKLQKQQDEQTKNNNLQLELQDKYNLTKNENIGLQLKIDQTESLNEDMKNEIDHMKLYLKSYKDKCEKFEEYEIKMKKEIENVLNKNITGMGFDEQLKELFNMYYQYKNDIHSKEEVSKKDKEQIKELYEQIDKLKQDHNQFKQKVEKEKSKYKSEISSQIENIDKLKQEIKGKNIKLFEMNKEKEKQVLLCQALEKKIKDYEFKLEISNLRYEEVYKKMILEKSEKIQLMEKHNTYTMDEKKKDIIINNLTLDVEKLNNKLKGKLKNEDQIQQENQKLTEQLHELQQQINKHNKNYQDLKIQLEDKTQESLHYVRKVREYEKERFEISKKLNALEELKAIHEKDIEELSQKTKQLNDTQKLAEEATLIASYKENEKNTILESYEENKKVQEEIIKEYEKKFTQKEKESSREVKALRNEIHSLKEANTNDKNKLTKDYENKIKRLNYEINSLEKENEALKNENLNLVMPKNQNQRIKYLRKIKNESDHWKEIALRFRRELDKRGIYIKL